MLESTAAAWLVALIITCDGAPGACSKEIRYPMPSMSACSEASKTSTVGQSRLQLVALFCVPGGGLQP